MSRILSLRKTRGREKARGAGQFGVADADPQELDCKNSRCDGLRWFKLCVKMSSCQKDVKCQIVKHLDYGGGSQKK